MFWVLKRNLQMCPECLKETSQRDASFKHQEHKQLDMIIYTCILISDFTVYINGFSTRLFFRVNMVMLYVKANNADPDETSTAVSNFSLNWMTLFHQMDTRYK